MFDLNDVPGRTTPKRTRRSTASTGSSCRPCSTATGTVTLPTQDARASRLSPGTLRDVPRRPVIFTIEIRSNSSGRPPTSPASCTGCDPTTSTCRFGARSWRRSTRSCSAAPCNNASPAQSGRADHRRPLPNAHGRPGRHDRTGLCRARRALRRVDAVVDSGVSRVQTQGKFGIHRYDPLASASTSRACEHSFPTTSSTTTSNWSTHE